MDAGAGADNFRGVQHMTLAFFLLYLVCSRLWSGDVRDSKQGVNGREAVWETYLASVCPSFSWLSRPVLGGGSGAGTPHGCAIVPSHNLDRPPTKKQKKQIRTKRVLGCLQLWVVRRNATCSPHHRSPDHGKCFTSNAT